MRSVGLEVGKERVPKPHRLKVRSQPDLEGTKSLVSDDDDRLLRSAFGQGQRVARGFEGSDDLGAIRTALDLTSNIKYF